MSDSGFKRSQRVGQLIQQELGRILTQDLKDPRVGFVTVTEVRVTDDLRSARVYVSVYGEDEVRQESLKGLRDAAGFLKREVFHRVKLKYSPTLTFELDDSLDRAQRLETLMSAIKHGETETPGPQAGLEVVPVKTARSELAEQAKVLEDMPEPPKESSERRNKRRKKKKRRKVR